MTSSLTFLAALGAGLIAGVFFAFSTFIMKALGKIAPHEGIAAMQSINVVVINPWFMTALFGTALLCLVLAILSLLAWQEAGSACVLLGSAVYLVGAILVTIVFNVPLNNALAAVDPGSPEGARLWQRFRMEWTAWNHVRTAASLAAAALLIAALLSRATAA